MSGEIDFRWGMPSLDASLEEGTTVPGFVLKHYATVGVSIQEMMFIIHLSAYHFNSPNGRAKPSLATIARLMGYQKDESVRRLAKALEKRGLLRIERRVGQCSTYDFQGLSQACFAIELALRSPTPMGDIPPTPMGDSLGPNRPVLPGNGGGPSHARGGPGLPSQGETPPHASGDEESEQNKNHQESEGKKDTPQIPGIPPVGDEGDDEALGLIQAELRSLGLTLDRVAGLRAGGDARALALIWQAHKGSNPAGLLIHLLHTGQSPPAELVERAQRLLAGPSGPDAPIGPDDPEYTRLLDLNRWNPTLPVTGPLTRAELATWTPPDTAEPVTATPEPPRPTDDAGSLNDHPPGSRLTWREIWLAVRNQLELQLNTSTFETWLKDAQAVRFHDGVLLVSTRHVYAPQWLSEHLPHIDDLVTRLAGQPVTVRYVTAEPELVHV